MIGDEGPYIELDGPGVWVPRTVPWRLARAVARTAVQEPYQRLRYDGKVEAELLGFVRDCQCEEVCELAYDDEYRATGDTTCKVPAWAFTVVED